MIGIVGVGAVRVGRLLTDKKQTRRCGCYRLWLRCVVCGMLSLAASSSRVFCFGGAVSPGRNPSLTSLRADETWARFSLAAFVGRPLPFPPCFLLRPIYRLQLRSQLCLFVDASTTASKSLLYASNSSSLFSSDIIQQRVASCEHVVRREFAS